MRHNSHFQLINKLFSVIILTGILSGSFAVNAQKSKTVAKPVSQPNVGWRGSITYKKTLVDTRSSNEKNFGTTNPNVERTKITYSRKYEYAAKVVFSTENGAITSSTKVSFGDREIENSVVTRQTRCRSNEPDQLVAEQSSTTKAMDAAGTGRSEDFYIRDGFGVYSFGLRFPAVSGESFEQTEITHTNFCAGSSPAPPPTRRSQRFTIKDETLSIDGNLDPNNPDVIAGSKTWGDDGSGEIRSFRYQVSWRFTRKTSLVITDIKFEDMKFPTWNEWQEIGEQKGTIDGNMVKIKATVLNLSGETKYADLRFKETYRGDKYDGARPDSTLQEAVFSVRVDALEEKEVEMVWDSSGYAWFDDGRPRPVQRIKAELEENGKKIDEMTKNLKIAPKPLVLIHGAWSHWRQFETWQNILTTSHSFAWKAFPVGEKTDVGIINTGRDYFSDEQTNTTAQNATALKNYIQYAQEDRNAWHVDVVAHSIGGLIARHYISQMMPINYNDRRPQITHLVMLGTPNAGSPCADVMDFAFEMTGKSPRVVRELTQTEVGEFNRANSYRKGVKFSALAGNSMQIMCKSIVPNDGFVPVPSALWSISDTGQTKSLHTELTGTTDFSDFVKPHLAIGPKGNHKYDLSLNSSQTALSLKNPTGAFFVNAAYRPQASVENSVNTDEFRPDFAKRVKLSPKQSVEIDVPVEQALNFGLTFMASNEISATLYDDKGTVLGTSLTKTPEASGWFRSIYVDRRTTAGTWKLKLENTSAREFEAIIATWKSMAK